MDLKILKGSRLLTAKAIMLEGEVYLPASALDKSVAPWRGELVFFDSPIQGKRICLTLLCPNAFRDSLPPWVEHLTSTFQAAGATVMWHDGGQIPVCDLILVIETGAKQTGVNYLGNAFRSIPLARLLARNIKKGLKLAYLPDPMPYRRPQYNLKPGLKNWLFTPAVALQWPDAHREMAGWILASLLEFWGHGEPLQGSLFPLTKPKPADAHREQKEEPAANRVTPEEDLLGHQEPPEPALSPAVETIETQSPPTSPQEGKAEAAPPRLDLPRQTAPESESRPKKPNFGKPVNPAMLPVLEARRKQAPPRVVTSSGSAAGMSQAQYPEFFKMLEENKRKEVKKEPFS